MREAGSGSDRAPTPQPLAEGDARPAAEYEAQDEETTTTEPDTGAAEPVDPDHGPDAHEATRPARERMSWRVQVTASENWICSIESGVSRNPLVHGSSTSIGTSQPTGRIAVSLPSLLAPNATRCTVYGRWPCEVNICLRVATSFLLGPALVVLILIILCFS